MQFNYGYRGMGDWLVGPEAKRLVESRANEAMLLYQAIVAKRSGDLARSARVTTRVGGLRGRRWFGVLTVGDELKYGASHEYGTKDQPQAAHDLRTVLENLQ